MRKLFLYIVFVFFINNYCAQTNRFLQLTTAQGLPIDNVYVAQQSNDGKMWFGTDFGIAIYDGYKFENVGKANGIATTAVIDMVNAGADSMVFIAYPNVLQSINSKMKVTTLSYVNDFSLNFLFKHQNRIFFYNKTSSKFGEWYNNKATIFDLATLTKIPDLIISNISSINENLFISTSKGVFLYNNATALLVYDVVNVVQVFQQNNETKLLTNNALLSKNANANFITNTKFNINNNIFYALQTSNSDIWFRGIDKGLYLIKNKTLTEISNQYKLEETVVNKIYEDRDKNIWLCTNGKGVLLIPKIIFKLLSTADGLANNQITQIVNTKKGIVVGTANGISTIKDNRISKVELKPLMPQLQYTHHLSANLKYDFNINITNTFNDVTNSNQDNLVQKNIGNFNLITTGGTTIFQQSENAYWSANKDFIVGFVNNQLVKKINIQNQKVRKVYQLLYYNQKLIVATTDGLLVIKNDKIEKIKQINKKPFGEVLDLFVDQKNVLWIATDNGVFTLNKETLNIPFTLETNLQKYCKAIVEDNDGVKWIATWGGLIKWNGNDKIVYDVKNGLSSNTINAVLCLPNSDTLYVGTANGLNIINKQLLVSDTVKRVLSINGYSNLQQPFYNGDKLKSNTNFVTLYLNVPYFNFQNNIQYEYKINNGNWQKTMNPNIELPNIKNGKYVITARATINGMNNIVKEQTFTFTIKTPFYKTWIFIIAVALLLQYLLFKLFSYYKKKKWVKQKEQHQLEMQMADLKQQAFTSLLNPHFIFNSLNSIQNYINKQDRQNANRYLSDFAKLIRRNFNSSKYSLIDLDEELETIAIYLELEKMRFGNKFYYEIIIDNSIAERELILPSLMIQPFVENAMLHGLSHLKDKGKLIITVKLENNVLNISIKDNGIGIEKSKQFKINTNHKSRGMQLIADRIAMFNKLNQDPIVLKIYPLHPDAENKGNVIELIIPQTIQQNIKIN